ncbi:MAG TPA: hypothetical protein GXZ21_10445, partial [Clostridiales bacterium]|nr:hypothetical protein [Clostridiales bacterium]
MVFIRRKDMWRDSMKIIAYIRSSNIYDDSRATKEITALLDEGYKVVVLGWNRDGKA